MILYISIAEKLRYKKHGQKIFFPSNQDRIFSARKFKTNIYNLFKDKELTMTDLFNYSRREASEVNIGATPMGGANPIRIQSMTDRKSVV